MKVSHPTSSQPVAQPDLSLSLPPQVRLLITQTALGLIECLSQTSYLKFLILLL